MIPSALDLYPAHSTPARRLQATGLTGAVEPHGISPSLCRLLLWWDLSAGKGVPPEPRCDLLGKFVFMVADRNRAQRGQPQDPGEHSLDGQTKA